MPQPESAGPVREPVSAGSPPPPPLFKGNSMRAAVRAFMRADGSQFAADRENRRKDRGELLDVAGALHFALRRRLRGAERRVARRRTGERSQTLRPTVAPHARGSR